MFWNACKNETAKRIEAEKRRARQWMELVDKVKADIDNWSTNLPSGGYSSAKIMRNGVVVGYYLSSAKGLWRVVPLVPEHQQIVALAWEALVRKARAERDARQVGTKGETTASYEEMVEAASNAMADLIAPKNEIPPQIEAEMKCWQFFAESQRCPPEKPRIPYARTPHQILLARALVALVEKHPDDWHSLHCNDAMRIMMRTSAALQPHHTLKMFVECVRDVGLEPIGLPDHWSG